MGINHDSIADEVLLLYQQFGNDDYIGEPVSQLEHMSQCAQLGVTTGAYTRESLEPHKPDYIIDSLHELIPLIEQYENANQ